MVYGCCVCWVFDLVDWKKKMKLGKFEINPLLLFGIVWLICLTLGIIFGQ